MILLTFTVYLRLESTSIQLAFYTGANIHKIIAHEHTHTHTSFCRPKISHRLHNHKYSMHVPFQIHTHTNAHKCMHTHGTGIFTVHAYTSIIRSQSPACPIFPSSPAPLHKQADGETALAHQRQRAPCLRTTPSINTCNTTFPGPLGPGISEEHGLVISR